MAIGSDQNRGSTILLDRAHDRVKAFSGLRPRIVRKASELLEPVAHASRDTVWISYSGSLTGSLTEALAQRSSHHRVILGSALLVHPLDANSIPALASHFRRIAFAGDGFFLPPRELAEVLRADHRANLVIGGFVNRPTRTVTLWRGDLESLTLPWSAFPRSGDGTDPDFDDFSVTDAGQTVALGDYEAAVDSILYDHDPEYRRVVKKQRCAKDATFGASLRRLRKQRGLRREDFEPEITARTVARIEQDEVTRIHRATLDALAARLGVEPDQIGSY